MTPDRFRACLSALGWSTRNVSLLLQVNDRTVRRWAGGEPIPERVALWLERLAAWHEANPPPLAPLDPRDPDPTQVGMFVYHNCWRCQNGAQLCIAGDPRQCPYPHARND